MSPLPANPFRASFQREAVLLRRRPLDLAMISWIPLMAMALVWWIFSAGLPTRLPVGVLDQDHSALSRQISRFLDAAPTLQVTQRYENEAEVEHALRRGDVHAVVIVPATLSRDLKRGRSAQVTLLHNAQLGTHSGLIQKDVRTVIGTVSAGIELNARQKRGESRAGARVSMEPLRAGAVTLFNPSLDYERFLAAALIPALLHIFAMTAGAWMVGRELRDRTLGDWLGPTPNVRQALQALLGKLMWPTACLALGGMVALIGLTWGRGWQPLGSLEWTLWALVVFVVLSISMGALAAAVTRSLRTALSATGFITAPAFAFGGVGFPLVAMPALAQAWALALPYTHYMRVQIEQLHMGAPLRYSATTPTLMLCLSALLLAATSVALRNAARQPQSWGAR